MASKASAAQMIAAPSATERQSGDGPAPEFIAEPGLITAGLSQDELRRRIAEAAYYRSEQRGFLPGYEETDWLEAETQVMMRLALPSASDLEQRS
jgi:hypothetical protein